MLYSVGDRVVISEDHEYLPNREGTVIQVYESSNYPYDVLLDDPVVIEELNVHFESFRAAVMEYEIRPIK